jgi:hypothetical protein
LEVSIATPFPHPGAVWEDSRFEWGGGLEVSTATPFPHPGAVWEDLGFEWGGGLEVSIATPFPYPGAVWEDLGFEWGGGLEVSIATPFPHPGAVPPRCGLGGSLRIFKIRNFRNTQSSKSEPPHPSQNLWRISPESSAPSP